jgi:dienelactone hydrolase
MPVESYEFGMSPYGCYEMAGNVSEWCLNQKGDSFITAGGSWADLAYTFGRFGPYPGFYSSSQLGFRCVRNLPASQGDQGAIALKAEDDIPVYQPSSEADFKTWLTHYRYDKTELAAKVVEETETEAWRRVKIAYAGADGEQALAYLYLPKNFPKPYQVIHFLPASDVVSGLRSLPDSIEIWLPTLIKSGRAVFGVVLKGYSERKWPANDTRPNESTIEYRKQVVNWATDLRRGLDYLETRPDLETGKLAFLGLSNGANLGLVMAAVETRYRSVTLASSGLRPAWRAWVAEASSINFAPHIRAPKLMLSGRYDESFPLKTQAEPLFKLLREPKKLVVFEGGHAPTAEVFAPTINGWLDETLGPVKRK